MCLIYQAAPPTDQTESRSRSGSPAFRSLGSHVDPGPLDSRQQTQLSFWRTRGNVGPNSPTRLKEDRAPVPVLALKHTAGSRTPAAARHSQWTCAPALEWRLASLMQKASCSSLISFSLFSSRNNTKESLMSTTSISFWRMHSSSSHCSGVFSAGQTQSETG